MDLLHLNFGQGVLEKLAIECLLPSDSRLLLLRWLYLPNGAFFAYFDCIEIIGGMFGNVARILICMLTMFGRLLILVHRSVLELHGSNTQTMG